MSNCLLPSQKEKLKEALENGGIARARLFDISPEERVAFFRKFVGDSAKEITAKFEKAYMMPHQKQAMTKLFYEMKGYSPLYKGVSLEQATKLSKIIEPRDLRKMSSEQVENKLATVLDETTAKKLANRFANLKRTNNLPLWEKRTIGTEELRTDKHLLKGLNKINALDNLGVLSTKDVEKFMPSLIESQLGVDLNMDEAKKLSGLNRKLMDSYDKVAKTGNWTWENGDNVKKYFKNLRDLKDYAQILEEGDKLVSVQNANKIINYGRNSILATPKTALNSALYQIPPSMERELVKRIVSGQLSGNAEWSAKQLKMAISIYNKTGYDISRMKTLGTGNAIFAGEQFGRLPKKKGVLNKYGRLVELGPKYGAGGTDMLIANFGRSQTAWMEAKKIAKGDMKKAKEIVIDSMSFNPKTEDGKYVREVSMRDADMSNNTQKMGTVDMLLDARKRMKIKGVNFGTLFVPFAKISLTSAFRGMKIGSGAELVDNLLKLRKAVKKEGVDRRVDIRNIEADLVAMVGVFATAWLIASGLDNKDYIGAYDTMSYKQYGLGRSRNAQAGSVKLFGHWIPIRYLPLINVPLSGIMMARQSQERKENFWSGYVKGLLGGVLETPVIKQGKSFYDITKKLVKTGKLDIDKKDVINWLMPRMIPSIISRPLLNHFKAQRYDFMGREVIGGFMFNKDTTNQVILEFNRLDKSGNMPVISDPQGKNIRDYTDEELNKLKQEYTRHVITLINSPAYQLWDDERKKKQINKLRDIYILNKLKKTN